VADPGRRERLAGVLPRTRRLLADQYRFDEVYDDAFVQTGRDLGDGLMSGVENPVVQGVPTGTARAAVIGGRGLRAMQSGLIRTYAFAMIAGVVVLGVIATLVIR